MLRLIFTLFILSSQTLIFSQGFLCAIGGGSEDYNSWSDAPYSWIVEKSDSGKILILSYSDQDDWMVNYFLSLGASEANNFKISSRYTADLQSTYDEIISAKGLFIKGGDQWRYVSNWKGTKTENAIKEIYYQGGVIAGTSAGAMILSEIVFTAENGSIDPRQTIINPLSSAVALDDDFLGLFPNSIFDTHFVERGRFGRLIGILLNYLINSQREIIGIGIDDKTAICIDNDLTGRVYGTGAVSIFQFDSKTQTEVKENQYKIENLKCDKLTHGWEYDFTKKIISRYPNTAVKFDGSNFMDFPKTDIFLTGNSDNNISLFPDLDFFLESANTEIIGIIGDADNVEYQNSLLDELEKMEIDYNQIFLNPDSLNSPSLNEKLSNCTAFIVNSESYILPSILRDSLSLLGQTISNKIKEKVSFLLLGNNSKLAGDLAVYNTDINKLASYHGLMKLTSGMDLFGDLIIQPMIFSNEDFYENRTSALTYGMMRGRKKIGLYLDFDSRVKIDHANRTIFVEGTTPLIIVDARNTTMTDSSQFRVEGGLSNRQVAAMNNLRYTVAKFDKEYFIDAGILTEIKNPEKVMEVLQEYVRLLPNYPNPFNAETIISFHLNQAAKINIQLYNSIGEQIAKISGYEACEGLNSFNLRFGMIGKNIPSGIYYLVLSSDHFYASQKIVYLK